MLRHPTGRTSAMIEDKAAERVYMVTGDEVIGDHQLFVTESLKRAEAKREEMLLQFQHVRANWLETWEGDRIRDDL